MPSRLFRFLFSRMNAPVLSPASMSMVCSVVCSTIATTVNAQGQVATDVVIADFENADYSPWTATGQAFGPGPATGTLPGQMAVDGFQGKRLVNSFFGGDNAKGTLTSPEFRIERKYITFLIGGGKNEQSLSLQLWVGGNVVRSATGLNDAPGGSERLEPNSWDVSDLLGKTAILKIIDDAAGGWGHINVDHIVQSDQKPIGFVTNAERDFVASKRLLSIPIRNGAPKRIVTLLVDGKPVVRNDIELADESPDWWSVMDISDWQGKPLTLRVDKLSTVSQALTLVEQSDTPKDASQLYSEPMRGQFHFSPSRGWNNDPNGMVFYNGEYHLFFQHNPHGWGWGNMHWGHAVSRDMVHWEELSEALLPDEMGPMFSGSAVVDWKNTSGLGTAEKPPLVLLYTAAGNPTFQGLAYSLDGRTFTKLKENPILGQITGGNRDPKVIWHEPTKQWVMVLYVEWQGKHTVHFFTSPNLREWKLASTTEGDAPGGRYLFECPDFFELPIDGDATQTRWVLLGADSTYGIGTFDGTRFVPELSRLPGHRGRGFYAPQTFSDIPEQDGRRIQIGWWQTETRGMSFNQSMTIPLELRLTKTDQGPRMTWTPVRELESLRGQAHHVDIESLSPDGPNPLAKIRAELVELRAVFEPENATEIAFKIRDVAITYLPETEELLVNDLRAPAPLRDGKLALTVYCDRTGVEVFASEGLCYVPLPINIASDNQTLSLEVKGGEAKFESLDIYELKSAWRPK
jgi:fructan beta-fructosidase